MPACESAQIEILDASGRKSISIHIALLPRNDASQSAIHPLLISDPRVDSDVLPKVQLLESYEYRYEFALAEGEERLLTTDHADTFQADTKNGRSGRVRPGLYTGTLPIRVFLDGREAGSFSLEVRSRKLDYLTEYRWMVRDLADQMSAVVMNRFSPSVQQFRIDNTRDAQTLYQRFAFLKSLISGEDFQAAMSEIIKRPHVGWIDYHEPTSPNKGIKATSAVSRQLAKAGPRVAWDHPTIRSIPLLIDNHRTEVSVDTTPNRFVKFALEQWRDVVAKIADLLATEVLNPVIDRGLREVRETVDQLDALLAEGLFREIGNIDGFPADNQVLHKREGYRDVFRAYIQFDVAAKLSWDGGEDVYGAGKRDVATLYEYWAFMKLAELVSELCDAPFNFTDFIEAKKDSLNVTLKQGKQQVLSGIAERKGRELYIELWFNRSFNRSKLEGSWSQAMRPDYTMKISPCKGDDITFEPIFVHFDAKYRLNHLSELFSNIDDLGQLEIETDETINSLYGPKREDLLKMHAYRDAIKRSAGAYVIYPGTETREYRQYHELLPGLGAFALKPTEQGTAQGKVSLQRFIEDIFEHVASQLSQHERGRYWLREVYQRETLVASKFPAAPFLDSPPADTLALLGYVKNKSHWEWIASNSLYNLRADNRRGTVGLGAKALACDLVILSCPREGWSRLVKVCGEPQLMSKESMESMGYPNPRNLYYCFNIEQIGDSPWHEILNSEAVEKVRLCFSSVKGNPVSLSWLELIKHLNLNSN